MSGRQFRSPRRLAADEELYRRRERGVTLRKLAVDYGVSHTTLSRHFARPDAKKRLRQARRVLRAERTAEREVERRAAAQAARERAVARAARRVRPDVCEEDETGAGATVEIAETSSSVDLEAGSQFSAPERTRANWVTTVPITVGRVTTPYMAWLDERDRREPFSRADLRSNNDDFAAKVVATGGGIAEIIEVTGLRTEANVRRCIDPEILATGDANDAPAFRRAGL